VARRLRAFLDGEPVCRARIRCDADAHRVEPTDSPCCTLAFEPPITGPARFALPHRWSGDAVGASLDGDSLPLLNILCRVDASGSVDVWVRINHVGADGVPMHEMLSRLEAAWGTADPVVYPTPEEFEPLSGVVDCPGRADLGQVQTFVDFRPLLAWRSRQNSLLPQPMTVAAALLWCLNRSAPFDGLYMGSTVEVGATGALGRGVGVVVARPADYAPDADGLRRYVLDFNRQVEATRRRASGGCKTLDALAFVPPRIATAVLADALRRGRSAFGSLGLTILKDARVFGAPIGTEPHADGFIAIGSMSLPSTDGRLVGCVCAKGPRSAIAVHPGAIRDALRSCPV
jgi:hypothetical protein